MLNNHLISSLRNFSIILILASCASLNGGERIERQVYSNKKNFSACYKKQLKVSDRKELKGNLILDFWINKTGKVTKAKLQNSYWMEADFKKCLLSTLKSIKFDEQKKNKLHFIQPINFYPKKKK